MREKSNNTVSIRQTHTNVKLKIKKNKNRQNKKYVLWNMGICPIASKVRHVTLATPPLGSFIVPYIVLPMAYPTKKKRRV